MNKTPIFEILKHRFNPSTFSKWYLVGCVIGVLAWVWGRSAIPAFALKWVSGVGWFLILMTGVVSIFGLIALIANRKIRVLAIADFYNFISCAHPTTLRAASVLFGVSSVAGICWVVTGSAYAMGSALYGSFLGLAFLWFWVGLSVLDDAIEALSD